MPRYIDYAKIPMQKNDIGAKTIGEYFEKLLLTLWDEQEEFSGKRPFGNSGWEYDVYASLISAGVVDGSLDEEGYVVDVTYSAANDIVCKMIKQIFSSTADVVPKSEVERLQDDNKFLQDRRFKELSDVRRETAREIFEEIDAIFLKSYNKCSEPTELKLLEPLLQAERFIINEMWHDIAELKKKYQEGEPNG